MITELLLNEASLQLLGYIIFFIGMWCNLHKYLPMRKSKHYQSTVLLKQVTATIWIQISDTTSCHNVFLFLTACTTFHSIACYMCATFLCDPTKALAHFTMRCMNYSQIIHTEFAILILVIHI